MQVDLSTEDIRLLYGDMIYLVPEEGHSEGKTSSSGTETPVAEPVAEHVGKVEAEASPETETPEEKAPETPETPAEPRIRWIPKADSRVLFVLQNTEMKNKALTALLRKIVESLDIPFDAAGFGIIDGSPLTADWEAMPNPFGVVFDRDLAFTENPFFYGERELFFSYSLSELESDRDKKKELWAYLKTVKERL